MAYQANGSRLSKRKARKFGFRARMKMVKGGKVSEVIRRRRLKNRKRLTKQLKTWI